MKHMTDNPATPSLGTGPALDPEAGIASLLTDDLTIDGTGYEENPTTAQNGQPSQEDHGEDDASLETQSEESDEGDEDSEADEDSDDQTNAAEPVLTVKVDGKEMQVPQSEVIAGYQRQADYSRKTNDLAQARRQFDTDRTTFETERQSVGQERTHYRALLGQLQQAVSQLTTQEPTQEQWAQLQQEDPTQFLIARENWRILNDQKQAAQAELHRLNHQELAQQQQAWAQHVQQAAQTFRESIPAWKDEATGRRELGELVEYARNLGYSDDEIQAAGDPRALQALYKAMKFDALQSQARNLKPVARTKTLAAGSPQRGVSGSKRSNAEKRLARSGSIDDAAAIFETLDL